MVTVFWGRSTCTVATSGCLRKVFSIPVAQKAQTMPLTVVLIVSPNVDPDRIVRTTSVNRICRIDFPPSELHGPVDHDVLIAAVSDFQPKCFIEKPQDRRDHEVIMFRGMMIETDQRPCVELIVVREIWRQAKICPVPN